MWLLVPLLLSSALVAEINGGTSWVFPGPHNGPENDNTSFEETRQRINKVLPSTRNDLKNRFENVVTSESPNVSGGSASISSTDSKEREEATRWLNQILGKQVDKTTQSPTVNGNPGVVLPGTNSVNKALVDDATRWLNDVLQKTNDNLSNRFTLNATGGTSNFCTTTDGKDGSCVKPEDCNTKIVKDPTTQFLYRESTCSDSLQCCATDQIKQTNQKPKSPSTSTVDSRWDTNQAVWQRFSKLPDGCGWSNPGGVRLRELDPSDFANFAEYPWMVAILSQSHSEAWSAKDYVGGGTLIHPSVVLTVAHKVHLKRPDELKCRAGEWNTSEDTEIYEHQDRKVQKIVVNPQFVLLRAHYDAALLFLEAPFDLNVFHIGTACLAQDMPAPGSLCHSMGWGRSFENSTNSHTLKKVQLPLVDHGTCQAQLRKTILTNNYVLDDSLTCAGGVEGKDTCIGDGGSPLVCSIPSSGPLPRYAVYGMVAYGLGCGLKDVPGVYAKVPAVRNWINQQMEAENMSTATYTL